MATTDDSRSQYGNGYELTEEQREAAEAFVNTDNPLAKIAAVALHLDQKSK